VTRDEFEALSRARGDQSIVDAVAPYLSDERKQRIESVLRGRLHGIHVAVERPYDPHNAAAVVRSAEAFGVSVVHVVSAHARALVAHKTTSGSHRWVEIREHPDLDAFRRHLEGLGMALAGARVEDGAVPLESMPVDRPLCLLFGNEHDGLSPAARQACKFAFSIPMFGFVESLNLSVSAAVSLYSITRRRRDLLGRDGDLEPAALGHERARYHVAAVEDRLVRGLLRGGAT
jgi:tRNA (guanosine-2'-O-)-methyltransferase